MNWQVVVPFLAVIFTVGMAGMVGGPIDGDMNDKGTQDALKFAVAQHNRKTNDAFVQGVAKVVSVQRQVVAGMKYIFLVEMGKTSCRKGGAEEVCPVEVVPGEATSCTFEVWSRPWVGAIELIKNTCS